jgi:NAD-dependent oxidoreductase involved in siderophore biosynthesis
MNWNIECQGWVANFYPHTPSISRFEETRKTGTQQLLTTPFSFIYFDYKSEISNNSK